MTSYFPTYVSEVLCLTSSPITWSLFTYNLFTSFNSLFILSLYHIRLIFHYHKLICHLQNFLANIFVPFLLFEYLCKKFLYFSFENTKLVIHFSFIHSYSSFIHSNQELPIPVFFVTPCTSLCYIDSIFGQHTIHSDLSVPFS